MKRRSPALIRSLFLVAAVWLLVLARGARAQAPHEVLLLINTSSEASVRIADAYAAGRGIPEANRVFLDVPRRYLEPVAAIPADAFTRLIWEPALRSVLERDLDSTILAWIYSVDFPLRVDGDPPLSLTGLTFLRNRWPDAAEAADGRWVSPLYGGPDPPEGLTRPARTLDRQRDMIGTDTVPLPAAMLGYTGPGGLAPDRVADGLRDALTADGTRPSGTVYFVTGTDIRSRVRQWQYETAVKELAMLGVTGEVTDAFPDGQDDVLGILTGTPAPDPARIARYRPGAFGEHLTSFSAVYDVADQTKMTAWIAAGAAASAGVVTEPRAYWTKFPTARLFVYYAAGCTLLESFFQAVRCPLQSVLIGDPLMRPFAPSHRLVIEAAAAGRPVRARILAPPLADYEPLTVWLDGRRQTAGVGRLEFDPAAAGLPAGTYRLRMATRSRSGDVRHPLWAETLLTVPGSADP